MTSGGQTVTIRFFETQKPFICFASILFSQKRTAKKKNTIDHKASIIRLPQPSLVIHTILQQLESNNRSHHGFR